MAPFIHLDKERYRAMARAQGAAAALTALHHEMQGWEHETFEGRSGYQPDLWSDLSEVRLFSRELWDLVLSPPIPKPVGSKAG